MFERFFNKPDNNVQKEVDGERTRLEQEVNEELSRIDLTREAILKLNPEEMEGLISKINDIKEKIPRVSPNLKDELAGVAEISKLHEKMPKIEKFDDVIDYLVSLKGREKEFLDQIIEDMLLECIIEEKWKEYDKGRWREVMKEKLDRGTDPFGKEPNLFIDYYKKKGIDIVNPTEEDAKKYFDSLEYGAGPVTPELYRRRQANFSDIGEDREYVIQELLRGLLTVPDKGIAGFRTLGGEELEEKLYEIKIKLER